MRVLGEAGTMLGRAGECRRLSKKNEADRQVRGSAKRTAKASQDFKW